MTNFLLINLILFKPLNFYFTLSNKEKKSKIISFLLKYFINIIFEMFNYKYFIIQLISIFFYPDT